MHIKEALNQGLKEAMRARDERRKSAIRLTLAAIKNAEIEAKTELSEPDILAIIQKEVKYRHETFEAAELAGRTEMMEEATEEIKILEEFLPQQLSQQELEDMVRAAIAEVGATSPREMGNVMKVLMEQVKGRADGKTVSQIVRQRLTQ